MSRKLKPVVEVEVPAAVTAIAEAGAVVMFAEEVAAVVAEEVAAGAATARSRLTRAAEGRVLRSAMGVLI